MELLKVAEVAALLKVRDARVYSLIREGLIPAVRIGRQVRVSEEALGEWVRRGGQALPGGWRFSRGDENERHT